MRPTRRLLFAAPVLLAAPLAAPLAAGPEDKLPPKAREVVAAVGKVLPDAEAVADRVDRELPALPADPKTAVAADSARLRVQAIRSLRRLIAEQPGYLQHHVAPAQVSGWAAGAEFYLDAAKTGADPFAGAVRGVRPFRSRIDGQLLLYKFTLPKGFDPAKKYPLRVDLHSGGGFVWLAGWVDGKPDASPRAASADGAVHIAPAGRQHVGMGEVAVLDAIADALQHLPADPDRVAIGGASYGGTGGFRFGTLYPDRFAAAHSLTGGGNYSVPVGNGRFDAYMLPENLAALPFVIWDAPLEGHYKANRAFADRLRELAAKHPGSYPHREITDPKGGHGTIDRGLQAEGWEWIGKQARDRFPKRVVYTTHCLRYDGAYWVRVDTVEDPSKPARVVAEADAGGVRVGVENADRFHLDLAPELVGKAERVGVRVNGGPPLAVPAGKPAYFARGDGGWAVSAARYPEGLVKRHGLSGPVQDVFMEHPVLMVYGTAGGADRAAADAVLDRIVNRVVGGGDGTGVLRTGFERKADSDVTDADVREKNLVLVGTPARNRFLARVADRLPAKFLPDGVAVGGREYRGPGVGLVMVYPNPLNPDLYVLLVPEDYPGGKLWDYPDYVVLKPPAGPQGAAPVLARGDFDSRWRLRP